MEDNTIIGLRIGCNQDFLKVTKENLTPALFALLVYLALLYIPSFLLSLWSATDQNIRTNIC